ncbi:MAG: hypothetical protein RLZZ592_292 [Pseudomonadota bacterium]
MLTKSRVRSRMRSDIELSEKRKIVAYLENPVSCGLWHFRAEWLKDAGISADVWAEVEKETAGKDFVAIRSGKRERKIKVNEEWKSILKEEVQLKLTFIFRLFEYLAKTDIEEQEDEEAAEQYGQDYEITQLILDLIDVTAIRVKYADAVGFFKDRILYPHFRPITSRQNPTKLKSGFFLLQGSPLEEGWLAAIAWSGTPLQDLKHFLALVGKTENIEVMPVFSPEEEVFAPYFQLLGLCYEIVVPQEHLQPFIQKALNNFVEGNYSDCVSAIGLASEDVLTQVYETLFREQLTKGLTLGQLTDELNSRASSKFKKKPEAPPDLSTLFPEIKSAVDNKDLSAAQSVELLRKFLALTIESNKHCLNRIEKIGRAEQKNLIWTEATNHAVTELIRYRNAASHKSRIPIGPMECTRAAHSFVVLIRWWFNERSRIDWSKSPDEILRECVERNSKQ